MKKLNFIVLFYLFLTTNAFADFIDLAKRTSSVISTSTELDANNPHSFFFETMLTGQKVYLSLSSSKLNSSVYTLVNTDDVGSFRKTRSFPVPPVLYVKNLVIKIDDNVGVPSTCNGAGIGASDFSCEGKACTVNQRIISSCNQTNCWKTDATVDRNLISELSGQFEMKERIDISDCIPNNISGVKHTIGLTSNNTSNSILNGGTIQYSLFQQNDVSENFRKRSSR